MYLNNCIGFIENYNKSIILSFELKSKVYKRNFVNSIQTKEERRFKYLLCRTQGINKTNSQRMRDWTMSHICLYLKGRIYKNK